MSGSHRNTFLASPLRDTLFLLAYPFLVLAGLLALLKIEAMGLGTFIAFTAVYTGAHHLPGFLRAYGTRDVFDANRHA